MFSRMQTRTPRPNGLQDFRTSQASPIRSIKRPFRCLPHASLFWSHACRYEIGHWWEIGSASKPWFSAQLWENLSILNTTRFPRWSPSSRLHRMIFWASSSKGFQKYSIIISTQVSWSTTSSNQTSWQLFSTQSPPTRPTTATFPSDSPKATGNRDWR